MKKTTAIKLVNLSLLSIIIALLTSGTMKQVHRNIQMRNENTTYKLNATHDEIARYYALCHTAKLP